MKCPECSADTRLCQCAEAERDRRDSLAAGQAALRAARLEKQITLLSAELFELHLERMAREAAASAPRE